MTALFSDKTMVASAAIPVSANNPGDTMDPSAFNPLAPGATMKAVVTLSNGNDDKLKFCDVPIPTLLAGEALVQVLAAGINNTEINTRLGWYSDVVTTDTAGAAAAQASGADDKVYSGWNSATPFPMIQGTDCCGRVVAVAPGQDQPLIGKRVLVRPCMRKSGFGSMDTVWLGSDFDGAFAQYVKVPITEIFPVECDWSDAELGTMPCAYGTAENMLQRAGLKAGERVIISGASGGVGSAAIQLAKWRGAHVTAIAAASKADAVKALGADRVIDRNADLVDVLGENSFDLAVDIVAGPAFGSMLKILKRGGRHVSAGAIAGPVVSLDMRALYLKDLTLFGSTAWGEVVFPAVISAIETGAVRPLVAQIFPLEQIAEAQRAFLKKEHVGNFVLLPPQPDL